MLLIMISLGKTSGKMKKKKQMKGILRKFPFFFLGLKVSKAEINSNYHRNPNPDVKN